MWGLDGIWRGLPLSDIGTGWWAFRDLLLAVGVAECVGRECRRIAAVSLGIPGDRLCVWRGGFEIALTGLFVAGRNLLVHGREFFPAKPVLMSAGLEFGFSEGALLGRAGDFLGGAEDLLT